MIYQLKSIIGFQEKEIVLPKTEEEKLENADAKQIKNTEESHEDTEVFKTRIETLALSSRTLNALTQSGIRTVGGLARKREDDILAIEGIGVKGVQEIKRALSNFGITLKS